MKFLADMGMSLRTVGWLRTQGHDCVHLSEQGLQRATDTVVLTKALAEGRILLTLDLDFGYLMAISKAELPSLIIFRLGNETSEVVTARLAEVIETNQASLEEGVLVVVTDDTIRVRQLPIGG
ncbi:MAG: DUF5615 family PIN-like protein [Anaerolineae bacterium]|nr:DUF5615 family PIN-like protein [Anaerolineae bacterium]